MIFQIIIGVSALFAVLWVIQVQNKFVRWITVAAAVATAISLMPYAIPSKDGFIAYLLIQAVVIFYVFSPNDYDVKQKVYILIITIIPAIYMCLELTPYRGNNIVGMLCVVSAVAYLNVLLKERELLKDELGLLTIPFAHSVIRLSLVVMNLSAVQ